MSRLVKPWYALLVLLTACASAPQSSNVVPQAPPPRKAASVSGHVRGAGGRTVRLGYVKLGEAAVPVRADGSFEVLLPEGGARVETLVVSAVDHQPAHVLIANDHASVTVDVDLGTYLREPTVAPKIALGAKGMPGIAVPMLVLVDAKGSIVDATPDLDDEKLEAHLARLLK